MEIKNRKQIAECEVIRYKNWKQDFLRGGGVIPEYNVDKKDVMTIRKDANDPGVPYQKKVKDFKRVIINYGSIPDSRPPYVRVTNKGTLIIY